MSGADLTKVQARVLRVLAEGGKMIFSGGSAVARLVEVDGAVHHVPRALIRTLRKRRLLAAPTFEGPTGKAGFGREVWTAEHVRPCRGEVSHA